MIRQAADGAVLSIRVSAGARADRVAGRHGDLLKVTVRQAPERGKANRAVLRLLADAVGARSADLALVSGVAARDKSVLFRGWDAASLRARIFRILGAP